MNDAEFDAYLARRLEEPELPDEGFTCAVTAGLAGLRRRRRWALAGAVAASSVSAAIGILLAPAPPLALPDVSPAGVVATLLLAAACSLVWIATESRTPTR